MRSRARRRGGRGRRRPSRPTDAPAPSLWRRLLGFLGIGRGGAAGRGDTRRRGAPGAEEKRVLAEFCRHYGVPFKDLSLLKLALTHRSYLSVTGQSARESNERLEFLGDSVLGLVTSEFLYRRHPEEHEGQLTKIKSLLVSKAILSRRALRMGLGRFVLMSHAEVESGGRQRLSILADAFESVLGAIYLDQGFETARTFIHQHLLEDADSITADKRHTNYKSHLQEFVQSTYRTHPVYRIRSEYGPDHSKHFVVEVMVGRRQLGEGRGHNKKEAEQAAARDAIERVSELRREEAERRSTDSRTESETESTPGPSPGRRRGGRVRQRSAAAATPVAEPESVSDAEEEEERSADEQLRVDPYEVEESAAQRPRADEESDESEVPDEALEPRASTQDREAAIDEMERAMDAFGRGSRFGRRRRGR